MAQDKIQLVNYKGEPIYQKQIKLAAQKLNEEAITQQQQLLSSELEEDCMSPTKTDMNASTTKLVTI